MTTTYATFDLGTPIGETRILSGDMNRAALNRTGGERTRTDHEIEAALVMNDGDHHRAAAQIVEAKAAEFAIQATHIEQSAERQALRNKARQMLNDAAQLRAEGRK